MSIQYRNLHENVSSSSWGSSVSNDKWLASWHGAALLQVELSLVAMAHALARRSLLHVFQGEIWCCSSRAGISSLQQQPSLLSIVAFVAAAADSMANPPSGRIKEILRLR